ncbi:tRNA glutamyl-Q(34) synthetase GluQRS [Granulosicoccus antarcticus]|uniref:Glutamyl-Q tRNA(Asp) synthetase n=1 Tax=Granulosicoccus antarcticus IMCC3135 TaxID=1192854 RepID=A0A2Z2NZD6_9GAMM|nr:tRNA glutamyl-Q(34) synthetase GluQRS [Granulosicoccus antarcticus]ASJ75301.1 Glutamyl-Q tRNA(Asp) synthetase [Granulosicoccus antarcticus IMCC3135]
MTDGRLETAPAARPIGRFAPSPTGELHFGSLLAALASYCDARQRNGVWQLRIDDIDGPRSVPGSADAIQRSLESHGFQWDGPILWQSHRIERYHAALAALIDKQLVFACNCSRRSLPAGQIYPGHCRNQLVTLTPVADHALRLHMLGKVEFTDAVQGLQQFDLSLDVGDSIVWRRDQLVSYALACAVDDADNVTHVVRGADLLEGTGAQLGIIKALDLRPPEYAHLPVAMDVNGDKLSKHSKAPPIDEFEPLTTLAQAWQALGQIDIEASSVTEFWSQAISHWQMARVPRVRRITV